MPNIKLSDFPDRGFDNVKCPYDFDYMKIKIKAALGSIQSGDEINVGANLEMILCLIEKIEELDKRLSNNEGIDRWD